MRPKPMVEVAGKPLLWHIMKLYSAHGITDFIVCLGYRGYVIKEYFANFLIHRSDVRIDLARNEVEVLAGPSEPWKVTLIDTGADTMTGGRIKRVLPYIDDDIFCLTYGDGVADVDIGGVIAMHRASGLRATVTAVEPPPRFGTLELDGSKVTRFSEKASPAGGLINGGFFVVSSDIGSLIEGDATVWEREPLETLAASGQLGCYVHKGFWHPMDTVRDRDFLENLCKGGHPPWIPEG
jgi:glucose-1-phosphate cytidylyltransferase